MSLTNHRNLLLIILILITQMTFTFAATSLQQEPHHKNHRHHHKHRHKHQFLTINSNQIHDIREAMDDYLNTAKINFHELQPLRHHHRKVDQNTLIDEETIPAIHQHQHSNDHHLMNRHKRLHGGTRTTTTATTTTSTTTMKTIDNYDEQYDDDDESDTNRRVNDDAHAAAAAQHDNQLSEGESLTSYKMKNLGTREGVDRSFQEMQRNSQDVKSLINQNIRRTNTEGKCRWPNKKVFDAPYHPSKMYTPRKYVVYRCSDDTSCCGSAEKTCIAYKQEELTYWFHVQYFNRTQTVEAIKVKNHTECQCISKNPSRPLPISPLSSSQVSLTSTTIRPFTTTRMRTPRPTVNCKCPETFESVFSNDGSCECRCQRAGAECRARYEGREGFNLSDRSCIINRECTQPHCQYGIYQLNSGRCPQRSGFKFNTGSTQRL